MSSEKGSLSRSEETLLVNPSSFFVVFGRLDYEFSSVLPSTQKRNPVPSTWPQWVVVEVHPIKWPYSVSATVSLRHHECRYWLVSPPCVTIQSFPFSTSPLQVSFGPRSRFLEKIVSECPARSRGVVAQHCWEHFKQIVPLSNLWTSGPKKSPPPVYPWETNRSSFKV